MNIDAKILNKDWRCGTISRAPTLQVQSLSLNPRARKKKKTIIQEAKAILNPLPCPLPLLLINQQKPPFHLSCQAPGTHAYNPRYSGCRDQEDSHSRPALVNSSRDPILKLSNTKKGLAE
jgi:hypothetical protein